MRRIAAVDVGGTNMRVSIRDLATNQEISRRVIPTLGHDYTQSLGNLMAAIRSLTDPRELAGVGVGVAGAVSDEGVITGAGNLPDWIGHNYRADLSHGLGGLPVVVMNDCAAAALGEYAILRRPLIYVIWGTGVGGAVVSDSNSTLDVRPTEFGHITIDYRSTLQCGCGGYGHLEALVSGGNLSQQFGCKAEDLSDEQWSTVLYPMAVGIRCASDMDMDTDVVLGGGVATKQGHRLPELQDMVDKLPSTCPAPRLILAVNGEDSGLIGAGMAACQLVNAA